MAETPPQRLPISIGQTARITPLSRSSSQHSLSSLHSTSSINPATFNELVSSASVEADIQASRRAEELLHESILGTFNQPVPVIRGDESKRAIDDLNNMLEQRAEQERECESELEKWISSVHSEEESRHARVAEILNKEEKHLQWKAAVASWAAELRAEIEREFSRCKDLFPSEAWLFK